ncbi:T9SS type A sorting domain-containing protein [Winogradskyella sp.]|uniref:T9SS type A sorting domain-containing protein n=1 Tax=Winogradskyella sp. TaxID=1883156 RepID=UPI0025CEFC33|nr:T9SS type A sorting domain-containing protein [Winogradskyella sp.]
MKHKLRLLVLLISSLSFSQVQIGQDIDGESAGDFSGRSISLSSDGSIVAIGASNAKGYDANGNLGSTGHVRIYENQSGTWSQIGQDIDGDVSGDNSGFKISLSSNGSIVAISCPIHNGNGGTLSNSGHVRIYENQSGTWVQVGQDIDGEATGDESGQSVSLSSDGSIVAIGATENVGYAQSWQRPGHVRIYENQSGTWVQIGQDIDGEGTGDESGFSVSLSSNGSSIAIGSILNDGNGGNSGHVRVYENQSGTWVQVGQDIDGEATGDFSGRSISLSSDGSIVAIGANDNDGNGFGSGHVRIYENQSGTWVQIGQDIDGESAGDNSGNSISLSSDGSIVAIGAEANDGNGLSSGHVRVYENQSGIWTQIGQDIDGEVAGDALGYSVSLSSDSSSVAISAISNDGNGINSGQVRVYDLSALLSLNEFALSQFKLYPNPTKNQFTIQLNTTTKLKSVYIYNNLGQLVLTSKKRTINSSKLAAGVYTVEIETTKGKASKKLIIE